jgi:hypothetical protein
LFCDYIAGRLGFTERLIVRHDLSPVVRKDFEWECNNSSWRQILSILSVVYNESR